MEDITSKVREKRSKAAQIKIEKMLQECNTDYHLAALSRYIYLYLASFPEMEKDIKMMKQIAKVEHKILGNNYE